MDLYKPAKAIAVFGIFVALFVVIGSGSNRVAQAQSWNAPSFAPTSEVGECYDRAQRYYNRVAERYRSAQVRDLDRIEVQATAAGLIVATGVAIGTLYVPGPWSIAAILSGGVAGGAIYLYYRNERNKVQRAYNRRVASLQAAADNRVLACEQRHLDGGDPENEADDPRNRQARKGNSGSFSIIGGSQSIGSTTTYVTVIPVN